MKVQFINAWNGYDENAIYDLADAEATRLIALGIARAWTVAGDSPSDRVATIDAKGRLLGAGGSVVLDMPQRFKRLVAGRSGVNSALGGGANDSNANFTAHLSRTTNRIGPGGASNLQVIFSNFINSTAGEVNVGNPVKFRAALEIEEGVGGTKSTIPLTFGGQLQGTIDDTAGLITSDPLPMRFPANTVFAVRIEEQVSSAGQLYPRGNLPHGANYYIGGASPFGEFYVNATGNQAVYSTGAIANNGAASLAVPLAIIGNTDANTPAICYIGDSISRGSGDNTVDEIISGLATGAPRSAGIQLTSPGIIIPWTNLSRDGAGIDYANSTKFWGDKARMMAVLPYCTHLISGLGNNDCASTPPLATVQAKYRSVWAYWKGFGLKVYQRTLTPRTTGTWATPGGQTIVSGFASNAVRGQLNAWILAGADGLIDGVSDVNAAVEDPANPGKWRSDVVVTDDGTHPNAAGHKLMRDVELVLTRAF